MYVGMYACTVQNTYRVPTYLIYLLYSVPTYIRTYIYLPNSTHILFYLYLPPRH